MRVDPERAGGGGRPGVSPAGAAADPSAVLYADLVQHVALGVERAGAAALGLVEHTYPVDEEGGMGVGLERDDLAVCENKNSGPGMMAPTSEPTAPAVHMQLAGRCGPGGW